MTYFLKFRNQTTYSTTKHAVVSAEHGLLSDPLDYTISDAVNSNVERYQNCENNADVRVCNIGKGDLIFATRVSTYDISNEVVLVTIGSFRKNPEKHVFLGVCTNIKLEDYLNRPSPDTTWITLEILCRGLAPVNTSYIEEYFNGTVKIVGTDNYVIGRHAYGVHGNTSIITLL